MWSKAHLHFCDSGLDADLPVDTVLVIQVYMVSLETLQGSFACCSNMLWGAVHICTLAIGMRHQPKFGCQSVLIPPAFQSFA